MLTFLDRLLPYMARLARRADLAVPVFVGGGSSVILPAVVKEAE